MEAKKEAEFTLEELSERLRKYIHEKGLLTENKKIDYKKLSKQIDINEITLRNIVEFKMKSCAWATWNKIVKYIGMKAVLQENQAA